MIPGICGLDLGSWTFKICAFANKTFDILINQANFRQTPTLIGFTQSQRLIGQQALNKIKSNYSNTIRAPLRLIGLQKSYELCQQQLKYSTAKYQIGQELTFYITGEKQSKIRVQPEQLLIAFLGRIKKMIESQKIIAEHLYISVPSYLSQFQRKIIKKCAEIAETGKQIHLVDDWLCLATQYSYIRLKQLSISQKKNVIFVDFGYSKLSLFVVQFSANVSRLLDCEHMRFVGSKNMDQLLAEYYDQRVKKQRHSQISIFNMTKSYVKLFDHIQKQRKILSANNDHHLNVDSLIEDYDLSYLMKRDEFQKIIHPVISSIKKAFTNVKSRMPSFVKIHSIQILGGASRTPILKSLINEIFHIEPSKTLNQSQAMVHGATVYAVKDLNILGHEYNVPNINLTDIYACWNFSKDLNYYGEDQTKYRHKEKIFAANAYCPNEHNITFANQGPVEMYIYYGHEISRKTIGYIRFKTPNKIKFIIDSSKIIHVSPSISTFDVCKFYDKKQQKWVQIRSTQQLLQKQEERIKKIYDLKNEYESKLYLLKNNKEQYKDLMSYEDTKIVQNALIQIQQWIQKENNRPLGTQQDLQIYQHRIRQLITFLKAFHQLDIKKQNIQALHKKYECLKNQIQRQLLKPLNSNQINKLNHLRNWAIDSYNKMKQISWEGYYLTDNSLDFAFEEIKRILNN